MIRGVLEFQQEFLKLDAELLRYSSIHGTPASFAPDIKVRCSLACQLAVEGGMSFSFMPPFPARKALYDIHALKDPKKDLFDLYPEAPLCKNCNACTEACPQNIDVRAGVWKAVFGEFKTVSEMFMDCVMCG